MSCAIMAPLSPALLGMLCVLLSNVLAALDPRRFDQLFTRRILATSTSYGNLSSPGAPTAANLTVGIIGAGAAGLYSAILLESLGIDCEILEANNRPGGRIYTHYFDEPTWQKSRPGEPAYYDYVVSGS